jgi:hypothetical protein
LGRLNNDLIAPRSLPYRLAIKRRLPVEALKRMERVFA